MSLLSLKLETLISWVWISKIKNCRNNSLESLNMNLIGIGYPNIKHCQKISFQHFKRELNVILLPNFKYCQNIPFKSLKIKFVGMTFPHSKMCQKIALGNVTQLTGLIFLCVKNCPKLSFIVS